MAFVAVSREATVLAFGVLFGASLVMPPIVWIAFVILSQPPELSVKPREVQVDSEEFEAMMKATPIPDDELERQALADPVKSKAA